MQSITTDEDVVHLAKQLFNSAIVISPITYLSSEEHEKQG